MPDDLMRYDLLAQNALKGVVREALREWRARRVVGQLWDDGLASGRSAPGTTMADIKREARNRRSVS